MPNGTVKWFNSTKGFGFISNEDGADVFVHYTQIQAYNDQGLKKGDMVEYDIVPGEIGPRAAKVIIKEEIKAQDKNDNT
ncbi:MAG: cold-shock protein [Sedimentisphaerales bacterium]|nr:cold-shock protein [Sedimentisphaerales bacterium]